MGRGMDFGTVTWQPVSPAVWLQFDGSEFFHSLLPDSHPISIGCPGGINRGQHAPPPPFPSRETDDSKKLHWRYFVSLFSSPSAPSIHAPIPLFSSLPLNLTRQQSSRQETFRPSPLFQVGSAYPHKISLPSSCVVRQFSSSYPPP